MILQEEEVNVRKNKLTQFHVLSIRIIILCIDVCDVLVDTAHHMLQLTTPKIIFCTEKPVDMILKAMKNKSYSPIVVVYGDYPGTISFSKVLSGYTDVQVANFRYLELMPKGVELSNYCLLLNAEVQDSLDVSMVTMWFSSFYWISGIFLSIRSIARGVKIIIYPYFDAEMTCRLIQKYKVRKCCEDEVSYSRRY